MTAAVLAQNDPTPKITKQLGQLLGQRQGLVQIGQEVRWGWAVHRHALLWMGGYCLIIYVVEVIPCVIAVCFLVFNP
jgi:hypothetical protein